MTKTLVLNKIEYYNAQEGDRWSYFFETETLGTKGMIKSKLSATFVQDQEWIPGDRYTLADIFEGQGWLDSK